MKIKISVLKDLESANSANYQLQFAPPMKMKTENTIATMMIGILNTKLEKFLRAKNLVAQNLLAMNLMVNQIEKETGLSSEAIQGIK